MPETLSKTFAQAGHSELSSRAEGMSALFHRYFPIDIFLINMSGPQIDPSESPT